MIKRVRPIAVLPHVVAERLKIWGLCVRKQRVQQQITSRDLCQRLNISHPTLQRLERGEATVSACLYLTALQVLGMLPAAAPELDPALWQMSNATARAKPAPETAEADHSDCRNRSAQAGGQR